jgi:outer membrane protein, heavy metal efflux system
VCPGFIQVPTWNQQEVSALSRIGMVVAFLASLTFGIVEPARCQDSLTLDRALSLAVTSNPELAVSKRRLEAAGSRVADSGRLQNPLVGFSMENLGGGLGTDRTESTVEVGQVLELGGDRSARSGLTRSFEDAARAETATLEREVLKATADRFLLAWSLQERARHLLGAEQIASLAVEAAQNRLTAGAAPAFELVRAQGFRAFKEVERNRAETELASARRQLALQWGAAGLGEQLLKLEPPDTSWVPDAASFASAVSRHPERMRSVAEAASGEWKVREAKAARVPDLTLSAGVRHLAEFDETGFTAGISIPLPLWNRLGGTIGAAVLEHSAALERTGFVELRLSQELQDAAERYHSAARSWRRLHSDIVPSSEEALRQVGSAYRAGRLRYLDVLDTQRNLLETELASIDAIADLWRARVELSLLLEGRVPGMQSGGGDR